MGSKHGSTRFQWPVVRAMTIQRHSKDGYRPTTPAAWGLNYHPAAALRATFITFTPKRCRGATRPMALPTIRVGFQECFPTMASCSALGMSRTEHRIPSKLARPYRPVTRPLIDEVGGGLTPPAIALQRRSYRSMSLRPVNGQSLIKSPILRAPTPAFSQFPRVSDRGIPVALISRWSMDR